MCDTEPCLWLRGISPAHYAVVPPLSIPVLEYNNGVAQTINKDPEKELIVDIEVHHDTYKNKHFPYTGIGTDGFPSGIYLSLIHI